MTSIDARDLGPATTLTGDVCIIGAGVAGVTLATKLAHTDARVILLEGGGLTFTKSLLELPRVIRRHVFEEQQLAGGSNAGAPYYPLRFTRARALGGSSRAWVGHGLQAGPLNEIDMAPRAGLPNHGWPFERKDLDPWYEEAQVVCNLGPFDYDARSWERQGKGSVLPLDESLVRSTIFQYGMQSSFDRLGPALAAADNVQLITHATATRIITDASGAVTGIRAATLDGTAMTVDADTYVVAAGAIESARLLMVSTDHDPRGIGNAYDLVGRYFMEHPDVSVGLLIPDSQLSLDDLDLYRDFQVRPNVNAHAMFRPSDAVLDEERLLNSVIRVRPTYDTAIAEPIRSARIVRRSVHHAVPTQQMARHVQRAIAGAPALVRHQVRKRTSSPTILGLDMMSEQAPNPESRIRLGHGRDRLGMRRTVLDWRLTDEDWRAIYRATELFGKAVADTGLGRVVNALPSNGERPAAFGNWHHLGTTRMHPDADKGVVDANSQVHGVRNLYVTGGSVFPTGGYVNPTLTIAALALRLANHLEAPS